jgi:cysteine desulfuration protein SufE|tara:strand:- start:23 stop:433 length:411 start_codon:yes stop_codon:yes gene_type:complete
MADIKATMASIREEFSIFTNNHDKYVLLVDMANDTAGLAPEDRIDDNKILGCTSQAWIVREKSGNLFSFRTDSDAMIVKGLLSLIERVFNNRTEEEILTIDSSKFLTSIGLGTAISSQRTNGFSNAIRIIQTQLLD